jgi:hypothetical protein
MAKDKSKPVTRPASKAAPKGHFSKRHKTSEAHEVASARYKAAHGTTVRVQAANARNQRRSQSSPKQQLAALDKRLGVGVGASKERERLNKLIKAA